jgi:hypothetical protein
MKIFESNMVRPFGTAYVPKKGGDGVSGLILIPGDNKVSDEDAAELMKLQDTKDRIEAGLLHIRAPGSKSKWGEVKPKKDEETDTKSDKGAE